MVQWEPWLAIRHTTARCRFQLQPEIIGLDNWVDVLLSEGTATTKPAKHNAVSLVCGHLYCVSFPDGNIYFLDLTNYCTIIKWHQLRFIG